MDRRVKSGGGGSRGGGEEEVRNVLQHKTLVLLGPCNRVVCRVGFPSRATYSWGGGAML